MSEHSTDEVHQAMAAALQSSIKVAMEVAELTAMRRMEQMREAQTRSDAERNEFLSRLSAERDGALPTMRQPWDEAWWQQAHPQQIAQTWEVTQGWARAGDPYAQSTLEHMGRQLKERHGVEVPHQWLSDRQPNSAQAERHGTQPNSERHSPQSARTAHDQAQGSSRPQGSGQETEAAQDARDRNLPGDRDEDRLRDRAHGEDAAALGSDETAMGLAEIHAPAEDVHAEAEHADDMRAAANQDREAANALATVEDAEAAEAVAVAAEGFSGTPSARLTASRSAARSQSASRSALRSRTQGAAAGIAR